MDRPRPRKPWFGPPLRGRRNTYYRAISNTPGILLFALIAALGAIALGFAGLHVWQGRPLGHDDMVLGGVGIGFLTLGLVQAIGLARA